MARKNQQNTFAITKDQFIGAGAWMEIEIMQSVKEPFADFLSRLRSAIVKAMSQVEVQDLLQICNLCI